MASTPLTEEERTAIQTALWVAAERYDENTKVLDEDHRRLSEQFVRQAKEARAIHDKLEQADDIVLIRD